MKSQRAPPRRRPRADAVRNRERVLVAASQIFSAGAPEASLDTIAQKAGVGIGTLYRHFPTREALFEAVYRNEVDQLFKLAQTLTRTADAVTALRKWLHAYVRLVATKKGMASALQLVAYGSSELTAYSIERLSEAIGLLLERAIAAGEIRSDVPAEDLLRALVGIFNSQRADSWRKKALRLVDVLVDGLRLVDGAQGDGKL